MRLLIINPLGVDVYDSLMEELGRRAAAPGTEVVVRSLVGTACRRRSSCQRRRCSSTSCSPPSSRASRTGSTRSSSPAPRIRRWRMPRTSSRSRSPRRWRPPSPSAWLGRLAVIAPRIASGESENLPQDANWVRRLIHRYGGESAFAGVFSAPTGHPERGEVARLLAEERFDQLRDAVRAEMSASIAGPAGDAAEQAWRDHDATVLFFACTFWSDLLAPIRERLPIPCSTRW